MTRFVPTLLAVAALLAALVPRAAAADPKDTWVYHQSTGELYLNGVKKATGYSGNKDKGGLNNPKKQDEENVGPIPRGEWVIGAAGQHPAKGPDVMTLTPAKPNQTKRSGFLIHGDNKAANQTASEGCIILGPAERKMIAGSKITKLLVVE